jgi:hypothetical protein
MADGWLWRRTAGCGGGRLRWRRRAAVGQPVDGVVAEPATSSANGLSRNEPGNCSASSVRPLSTTSPLWIEPRIDRWTNHHSCHTSDDALPGLSVGDDPAAVTLADATECVAS